VAIAGIPRSGSTLACHLLNRFPDAVALHLTRRTYAEMLRMALAVVSTIPAAQLAVKLHPRAPDDPIARALLSRFPSMESRVISRGPLKRWLAWSDCVLSCISSAGIDATLAGVPVIQLLPAGSGDVLPHEQWGMLGTARTEPELQRLVARALQERVPTSGSVARSVGAGWVERSEPHHNAHNPSRTGPDPNVFRNLDGRCAERIADVVLAAKLHQETSPEPAPHAEQTARQARSDPARSDPIPPVPSQPDRMNAVTTNR